MAHDSAQLISKCKQTKKRGQTDKILHAAGVASSSSSLDAADGVGRNYLVCELGGVNKGTYLARFLDARFLASLKAAGFSVEDLGHSRKGSWRILVPLQVQKMQAHQSDQPKKWQDTMQTSEHAREQPAAKPSQTWPSPIILTRRHRACKCN